ncbi:MAG: hypothetical protein ACR2NR_18140 [Solirubrobacteraceae bacterium]
MHPARGNRPDTALTVDADRSPMRVGLHLGRIAEDVVGEAQKGSQALS